MVRDIYRCIMCCTSRTSNSVIMNYFVTNIVNLTAIAGLFISFSVWFPLICPTPHHIFFFCGVLHVTICSSSAFTRYMFILGSMSSTILVVGNRGFPFPPFDFCTSTYRAVVMDITWDSFALVVTNCWLRDVIVSARLSIVSLSVIVAFAKLLRACTVCSWTALATWYPADCAVSTVSFNLL